MIAQLPYYYAGILILASLLIGGGTTQNLWTDLVLQILLLPCVIVGLFNLQNSRLDVGARLLVIMIMLVVLAQFIPVIRGFPIDYEGGSNSFLAFWSNAAGRSLNSALFVISLMGFAVLIARFRDQDQARLVRFVFIGFLLNLLMALIQLSFSGKIRITGLLPYEIFMGTFANINHFSSLMYAMIPLIAVQFLFVSKKPIAYWLAIALVVLVSVAVKSQAAISISLSLSVFCYVWFHFSPTLSLKRAALIVAVSSIVVIFCLVLTENTVLDAGLRPVFFRNTIIAVIDHLPFGSGLGTFDLIYPSYVPVDEVVPYYANHAHNDFLEIGLELGFVGLGLIVFYFVLIIKYFARSPFSEAAAISILALSVHSAVDYPLRTMALAILFSFFSAVVLSSLPFALRHDYLGRN